MKNATSAADLIGEDRHFQERYWTFQRFGWGMFALIVLASLLGFAGAGGPFAGQTLRSGSALIDVPRAMRWEAEDQITVRQGVAPRESIEIVFSPEFAEAMQILSITPSPFQAATTRAGTSYWFFLEPGSQANIVFHVKPLRPRLQFQGAMRVSDGAPVPVTLPILP